MLFIAENFANCCQNLRWRNFDWFGTNPSFNIKGNEKFQTNTGAFVTLLYVCLIIACCAFYTQMLVDKSSPDIQTNTYASDLETTIDFIEDDVAWMFGAWRSDEGRELTYNEFEENFTLYVAQLTYILDKVMENTPVWTKVPVIPCDQSKKDYKFGDFMLTEVPYGVCLDFTGIVTKNSNKGMIESINIALYRCIETAENIAAGVTKCKNDIPINNLWWFSLSLDKSFNLNDYENPISYNFEDVSYIV